MECNEIGMRDSTYVSHSKDKKEEDQRYAEFWKDLTAWPWASEVSRDAKTALNGGIIKNPNGNPQDQSHDRPLRQKIEDKLPKRPEDLPF